ncbi:MAG: hypothetical protein NVSMB10_11270 [Steroidobacteraceae bacterium]
MQDDSARAKLWTMIKKYRFAMMTTHDEGALRSRPMTTVERDFDGSLWFFARADSAAATSVKVRPEVCLSYSDERNMDFISVAGTGSVVTDVAKKKELWKPTVQAWFADGPESPHNVLIKVAAEHAEYWDSQSNRLVQLFSMAKALATGTAPKNMGEHGDVSMPGKGATKSAS